MAFEVGEVRNGAVLLERSAWAAADGLPFERIQVDDPAGAAAVLARIAALAKDS